MTHRQFLKSTQVAPDRRKMTKSRGSGGGAGPILFTQNHFKFADVRKFSRYRRLLLVAQATVVAEVYPARLGAWTTTTPRPGAGTCSWATAAAARGSSCFSSLQFSRPLPTFRVPAVLGFLETLLVNLLVNIFFHAGRSDVGQKARREP